MNRSDAQQKIPIEVHNPKGVFLTDEDVKIFLAEVRKYKEKMDANSLKTVQE